MVGRSRENKKDHYYQCSSKRYKGESCGNRSINIDKIEGIIWSRFFKGSDLLDLLKKDIIEKTSNKEFITENISTIKNQLQKLQQQKDNLILAVANGLLDDEDIKKQKNKIDLQIKESNILLNEYEAQFNNLENSNELIKNYIEEFEQFTDLLSFLEQKEIVGRYIENIKIISSEKDLDIYSLIIKFKIKTEEEHYLFFRKKNLLYSVNENELIYSKFFNDNTLKTVDFVPNSIMENIIFVPSENNFVLPPYIKKGKKLQFISNTIFPYGDIHSWSEDNVIGFYTKNPKLFCDNSGLSCKSLD